MRFGTESLYFGTRSRLPLGVGAFTEREEKIKKNKEEENKKALSLIKGLNLSKQDHRPEEPFTSLKCHK
jgi:hypothetical protein